MKVEITLDKENILLKRREIKFEVAHTGAATPNKFEVSEILAAKLNAQMDMMIVSLSTQFGSNMSKGTCVIYKDKDAMKTAESQKILNERKMVGKRPGEAPAEEPVEEAKSEEPVEEVPAKKIKTKAPKEEVPKETKTDEPKSEEPVKGVPAKDTKTDTSKEKVPEETKNEKPEEGEKSET